MTRGSDTGTVKLENRRVILDVFRRHPTLTVAEAAALTGISVPTVRRVSEFFKKKHLLIPVGKGESTDEGGKKPILLAFNAEYRYALCHQILADGLLCAVADMRGRLLGESSISFPGNTRLKTLLAHIKKTSVELQEKLRITNTAIAGVVIGCHGVTNSQTGCISSSPYYPSWGSDIPFRRLVADLFGDALPVYIDNSNRFEAYAEMRVGQALGKTDFIIIDGETDGIGGGLVLDGAIWHGDQHLAGEIGHMLVDVAGNKRCTCGGYGCLETVACVQSLVEAARAGYPTHKDSRLFKRRTPDEVSFSTVYEMANSGDRFAKQLVENQARWLAMGILNVLMVADPALVVLQGPFAKGGAFLVQSLKRAIDRLSMPRLKKTVQISLSTFGRERALMGGAHFLADTFFADADIYE